MTVEVDDQTSDLARLARSRGWWSSHLTALAFGVGLMVLGGVVCLWVSLTRPDPLHLFGEHGDTGTMSGARVGEAFYFDTGLVAARPIVVDSLAPVVVVNSADADVTVVVCVNALGTGDGGVGALSATDIGKYCSSLRPARPGERLRVGYGARSVQLLYAITPHTRGRVAVEGVRFNYHQGDRHGHERCGLDVRLGSGTRR